ncbi:MAG: MATE family efflux transporter [Thermoplasmatota archaeon]
MSTAVVSVIGAAYGAKDYKKLKTANIYSIKVGLIIELIIAISTFLLAHYIAIVFTQGAGSERILDDLTRFLQIICIFYPTSALGITSSATFQGIGKGFYSLLVTLLSNNIDTTPYLGVFCNTKSGNTGHMVGYSSLKRICRDDRVPVCNPLHT